jgi:hypothetical protein
MSYLDRLMAQTGVGLASAQAAVQAVPLPALVEIDVRQVAPPPAPIQPEAPGRASQPAPPDAPLPPHDAAEVGAAATPAPAAARSAQLAPPAATHVVHAAAAEPSPPAIVIERRPIDAAAEPSPPRIAPPRIAPPPMRAAWPEPPPATAWPGQQNDERPRERAQPGGNEQRATFLQVRDWVAMTQDDGSAEAAVAAPGARGAAMPPEQTTLAHAASPMPPGVPERMPPHEETHAELSIGTMQVIVEAPAAPVPPARPLPPAAAPPAPALSWSRLSRRYLRR